MLQALFYLIPQALSQMGQISSGGHILYNPNTGVFWQAVEEKNLLWYEILPPIMSVSLCSFLQGLLL